jgi:hypothetical protein
MFHATSKRFAATWVDINGGEETIYVEPFILSGRGDDYNNKDNEDTILEAGRLEEVLGWPPKLLYQPRE